MSLKILMAVTIFAAAPIVAFAQKAIQQTIAKPTLSDAQKVVQTISSDKPSSKRIATSASSKIRWRKPKRETIPRQSMRSSLRPTPSTANWSRVLKDRRRARGGRSKLCRRTKVRCRIQYPPREVQIAWRRATREL